MQNHKLSSWLILILLAFIWGSSFFLIKIGLVAFSPMQVNLLRIGLSGIALLPFLIRHSRGTSKVIWGWCLLLGIVGNFIPFLSFAIAQSVINSSLAGMLNSLQPLFALGIGILVFKQHMPQRQIIGVLIGFAGAIILLSAKSAAPSPREHLLFSLLVVLATFCYGIAVNIIREYLQDVSPIKITSLSLGMLILPSGLLLFFSDLSLRIQSEDQALTSLYAIGILALFGTSIAIILYNKLIKDEGMMMASSVAYLIPLVAIFWGIFDGEQVNSIHVLGISVIFIGLYLINKKTATKQKS